MTLLWTTAPLPSPHHRGGPDQTCNYRTSHSVERKENTAVLVEINNEHTYINLTEIQSEMCLNSTFFIHLIF